MDPNRRSGLFLVRRSRGGAGRHGAVASIKAAEKWLKAATDDIRNDRLAPLAKQARSMLPGEK